MMVARRERLRRQAGYMMRGERKSCGMNTSLGLKVRIGNVVNNTVIALYVTDVTPW